MLTQKEGVHQRLLDQLLGGIEHLLLLILDRRAAVRRARLFARRRLWHLEVIADEDLEVAVARGGRRRVR